MDKLNRAAKEERCGGGEEDPREVIASTGIASEAQGLKPSRYEEIDARLFHGFCGKQLRDAHPGQVWHDL